VDDGQLDVLCSFFPIFVFTKNVVGDAPDVRVALMLPAEKGCPHDYDLTPQDVRRIATADVYVMNGAGLEAFGENRIREANPNVVVVDSSKGIEGLECDHDHDDHAHHEHDHDHKADDKHDHGHKHDHAHEGDVNPHFFSSPRQAALQVRNIAEGLAKADPKNAETYRKNAEAYAARLTALAEEFESAARGFEHKEIVTMHEVFDYLARDSGLKVAATIFPVAGVEPSPAEVKLAIETIRESKAPAVFTEPQYPQALAKTVANDAGVVVEQLDPVASGPPDAPLDYYETTMRANLEVLKRVLGKADH
jgi:ABC-type Zn uptake system ZnuABC Zn-binding protein ZnuA